jgi:hypothetical protein
MFSSKKKPRFYEFYLDPPDSRSVQFKFSDFLALLSTCQLTGRSLSALSVVSVFTGNNSHWPGRLMPSAGATSNHFRSLPRPKPLIRSIPVALFGALNDESAGCPSIFLRLKGA